MSNNLTALLSAMRLPFLLLTVSVVLLGISSAINTGIEVSTTDTLLVILGALAAHISVNLLNEYQDFHSGLDALTKKTPFSGGSGALIKMPSASKFIGKVTIVFLAITIAIGLYFTLTIGFVILAMGMLGIAIIVLYTQWINQKPILCLIATGLAFGPLMIIGTYYVLTGEVTWDIFLISLVAFFLTNNLQLINQFPDIEPDKSVGRNNFPIQYGLDKSIYVYLMFALLAVANTIIIFLHHNFSAFAYIALAPMLIQIAFVAVMMKNGTIMNNIITAMVVSVASANTTPLIIALVIYLQYLN